MQAPKQAEKFGAELAHGIFFRDSDWTYHFFQL